MAIGVGQDQLKDFEESVEERRQKGVGVRKLYRHLRVDSYTVYSVPMLR